MRVAVPLVRCAAPPETAEFRTTQSGYMIATVAERLRSIAPLRWRSAVAHAQRALDTTALGGLPIIITEKRTFYTSGEDTQSIISHLWTNRDSRKPPLPLALKSSHRAANQGKIDHFVENQKRDLSRSETQPERGSATGRWLQHAFSGDAS
jgi:hypothetical protein